MDENLSRHVLRAVFRTARDMQDLFPALEAGCEKEEYNRMVHAIAEILAKMGEVLTNPILSSHPGLEEQVDQEINKYGQML